MYDILTEVLLEQGLSGAFKMFGRGFKYAFTRLSEYAGGNKAASFESVSEYWFEGVDGSVVGHGSKVKVRGVVSMYVPVTPRHPRGIPGRQIETWLGAGMATSNFAHQDFMLWNDGILAPPPSISRKAILGLNDRYGFVGQGGVPVVIDLTNPKHKEVYEKMQLAKPTGFECTVTGILAPFGTPEILAFGLLDPKLIGPKMASLADLPNFVIEATDIEVGKPHSMLLGTIWMGLQNSEISPIYCNLFDRKAHAQADSALNQQYGKIQTQIAGVYDPDPFYREHRTTPPLNENLIEVFKKI